VSQLAIHLNLSILDLLDTGLCASLPLFWIENGKLTKWKFFVSFGSEPTVIDLAHQREPVLRTGQIEFDAKFSQTDIVQFVNLLRERNMLRIDELEREYKSRRDFFTNAMLSGASNNCYGAKHVVAAKEENQLLFLVNSSVLDVNVTDFSEQSSVGSFSVKSDGDHGPHVLPSSPYSAFIYEYYDFALCPEIHVQLLLANNDEEDRTLYLIDQVLYLPEKPQAV
jgi:hypothetical protein